MCASCFTRGGIARVLGRPRILELVVLPLQPGNGSYDTAGLHLSREYFDRTDPDTCKWQRDRQGSLAPSPNLSLNVGIKRPSNWIFYIIACIGAILQIGVLALAAVGVWRLHWNLIEGNDIAAKNYAPIMYILGTIFMCSGMWSCAYLIGETTREVRFTRKHTEEPLSSQLVWLQPGPQVIGDQSFDPFAYIEDLNKNPIKVWTSSTQDNDKRGSKTSAEDQGVGANKLRTEEDCLRSIPHLQ